MKKIFKFFTVCLAMTILLSLAGCGNKEEKLPASNEKIAFSYESDEYEVSTSKQTITVKKEGNLVMVATMVSEEGLQQYLDTNKDSFRVLEFGITRGLRYVDCEQVVGDKKEYVRIGWVIGTNTGIVFDGTENRVDMSVAIKDVSISCDATEQSNPTYYSYKIDDFIGSSSSQLEKIDYGFYQSFNTESGKEKLSSDWKDCEIMIDGTIYTFPVNFKLLRQNGWLIDRGIKKQDLSGSQLSYVATGNNVGVYLMPNETSAKEYKLVHQDYGEDWNDDDKSWQIEGQFKNQTGTSQKLDDCPMSVFKINVFHKDRFSGGPEIELAGGLKWGSSKTDILELYGKPSRIVSQYSYTYMIYENDKNPSVPMQLILGNRSGLLGVVFGTTEIK
jgi:uncharacterized lipoprotein YehR (DUF1307 family)